MAKAKNYQRYPAHFKRMALEKAASDGMTDAKVCEELGISDRQLRLVAATFIMPAQRQPRLVKIVVDLEPRQMVGAARQERSSAGIRMAWVRRLDAY